MTEPAITDVSLWLPWFKHIAILICFCVAVAVIVLAICGARLSRSGDDIPAGTDLAQNTDLRVERASVPLSDQPHRPAARVLALRPSHTGMGDRERLPLYKVGSDLTTREQRLAKHPQRVS